MADELHAINTELADLLRGKRADLRLGADDALADELIICGILGGKDVGKSTLINALAQTQVSVDTAEVGRGTERPVAYVHEQMQDVVRHRLRAIQQQESLAVEVHDADAIRNVVLLDLPDFDSEFQDHLRIVRAVAPLLDRVLWVQTPRKLGDRAWIEMFKEVVKDARNVHCVLNKVDELLADFGGGGDLDHPHRGANGSPADTARLFWQQQHEWVWQLIDATDCPQTDEQRFLVAAAFAEQDRFVNRIARLWDDPAWSRYSSDRQTVCEIAKLATEELSRLRMCVLAPVSSEQTQEIKRANRDWEQQVNVEAIRHHYDIDRTAARLAQACDPHYLQTLLGESIGAGYSAAVAAALRTRLRPDAELADELLEHRVEAWPLLRLIHWPFGWLSRAVGRTLAAGRRSVPASTAVDAFVVEGRTLVDRIQLVRSRFVGDNAVVAERIGIESELPEAATLAQRVSAAAEHLVPQLETRLISEIAQRDRRPSVLGKAMLWLILFWFPVLQPMLEGALDVYLQQGGLDVAHGLYKVVSAFSAAHLLAGFAVVAAIYIALLAGMYARRLRAVRRLRDEHSSSSPLTEGLEAVLVTEVIAPLASPFQDRLERLCGLQDRLDS